MKFTEPKFIALPVSAGDAFYLESQNGNVLFDGGIATDALHGLLQKYAKCSSIKIVICSHNDADHANGLIGLLKNGVPTISEVWLPGRWREGIERIASDPDRFYHELFKECLQHQGERLDDIKFEIQNSSNEGEIEDSDSQLDSALNKLIEDSLISGAIVTKTSTRRTIYSPKKMDIFFDAIDAANRILEIAINAYNRGCKIKWFDFRKFEENNYKAKGGYSWLEPLNSVEVTHIRRSGLSPLKYLALTLSNKESLVFFAKVQNGRNPGVLFCADSNLSNVKFPMEPHLIATAPHHGSNQNDGVYDLVESGTKVVWIRSDAKTIKRPSSRYISLRCKFCTLCRNSSAIKKDASFIVQRNEWVPDSGTLQCACL